MKSSQTGNENIFVKKQTHRAVTNGHRGHFLSKSVRFINWFITIFKLVSPAAFISTPFNVHKTNCNSWMTRYPIIWLPLHAFQSDPRLTDLVARGEVLVLLTGVPLLTVQQQEVDHLFLVVAAERRHLKKWNEKKESMQVFKTKVSHSKNPHLSRLVNYDMQYIINMCRPVFARAHNVKHKSPCDD